MTRATTYQEDSATGDPSPQKSSFNGAHVALVDSTGAPINTVHNALSITTHEHFTTTTEEFTANAGGDIAAMTLVAPAVGKLLAVYQYCISTDGSSGTIQIDFLTSNHDD